MLRSFHERRSLGGKLYESIGRFMAFIFLSGTGGLELEMKHALRIWSFILGAGERETEPLGGLIHTTLYNL